VAKSKTLSRSAFLAEVAARAGAHKRDVEHVWENALHVIRETVKKGDSVSISGFGKFKGHMTKARPARMGTNPFTGESKRYPAVPAKKRPKFLPAKQLKEYVGGQLKSIPAPTTRPMALAAAAPAGAKKAAPKKAAAKKSAKKAPAKKAVKKAAPKRAAAKKPAKRGAKRR